MELRVLGSVELIVGGAPVPIGGGKERALAARLALTPNRRVGVGELVDDLWGDAAPADPAGALQVHVSRVRKALRAVGETDVLRSQGGGYALAVESDCVDAGRFESLADRAREAGQTGDFALAAWHWAQALSLWRGCALADLPDVPFVSVWGPRLEEGRLDALECRVAADLACGEHARLVGELEGLTRSAPLRERLWALLMLALYRSGRQADALAAFRKLRRTLAEIGLEPGTPLRALEEAILRQAPQLDLAGFEPMALGSPQRSILAREGMARPAPAGAGGERMSWVRTPFVGRHEERVLLRRLLDDLPAGSGGLVLIGGEPGIGKTRLAEELMTEARVRGCQVLAGHSYEMEGAAPYVALVEILEAALLSAPGPESWRRYLGDDAAEVAKLVPKLRRLFPDMPPPLAVPQAQERRLLLNSVLDVLERACRRRAVLLVFDDLHWADQPTLSWIEQLADRLDNLPVLVVATYRDNEVDVGRPLAASFENLRRRRHARWLTLGRLSGDEATRMLTGLAGQEPPAGLAEVVLAGTEGNPFFVEEVYRYLADGGRLLDAAGQFRSDLVIEELEVPPGVRLVVGRRVGRLDARTPALLTAAAVFGRAFSVEQLEALDGADPDAVLDAIEDASRARLILAAPDASGEDRFIFVHELIRQSLLAQAPLIRRRRLHAQVADALERRYADNLGPHAAGIAHHLLAAGATGDTARVFGHLMAAGRFAMGRAAFEEALAHYLRAADLDAGTQHERAALAFELGNAHMNMGRLESAVQCWRGSLDAYETLDDAEAIGAIGAVSVSACYHLVFLGQWEDGLAIGHRGLEAISDRADSARSRLLGMTAFPLAYIGGYQRAAAMVEEALQIAEARDDDVLRAHGLFARIIVCTAQLDLDAAIAAGESAVALFAAAGDRWNEVHAAGFVAYAYTCRGRFAECHSWATQHLVAAERLGNHTARVQLSRMKGLIEFADSGDLARLAELGRSDRAFIEAAGMPWASGWSWSGLAQFLGGDWDGALPLLREAIRREPSGGVRGWNAGVGFECLAYAGREAEAFDLLEKCGLPQAEDPETWTWGRACMALAAADGLAVLGHPDRAAALYPVLLALGERTGLVTTGYDDCRLFERAAGIAAAAGRRWDLAERHFQAALQQAATLPHRIEEAHTRRWYGRMLLERDRPEDAPLAERMLHAAMADYRRMGMPKHLELTADLLGHSV